MNNITIKRINITEYLEPYRQYIEDKGMDFDKYTEYLHGFVDPKIKDTIHISDKLEVGSQAYNRFVAHETRHILDDRSGLIPFDTIHSETELDELGKIELLRAETRAMVSEFQFMSRDDIAFYKKSQFENRHLYGFEDFNSTLYFSFFDRAERELSYERSSNETWI